MRSHLHSLFIIKNTAEENNKTTERNIHTDQNTDMDVDHYNNMEG